MAMAFIDTTDLFKSDFPECDLKLYFSEDELGKMATVEKLVIINEWKNYIVRQSLGLFPLCICIVFKFN